MGKANVLIVGMGEIGRPLFELIEENSEYNVFGDDLDETKCSPNMSKISNVDIIHICIPCKNVNDFVTTAVGYCILYNPRAIIINSTVPPRTTDLINDILESKYLLVHSPMFGRHENKDFMKSRIKTYIRLIGGINKESSDFINKYYKKLGFNTKIVSSPLESEIMKLMETTYAGWMITYFNEFHRLSRCFGANFVEVVDALAATYYPRCEKPIWYPDIITGHCIMQNIDLLLECYDSEFLRLIKKSNDKRQMEINNDCNGILKTDINKIKNIRHKMLAERGIFDKKS